MPVKIFSMIFIIYLCPWQAFIFAHSETVSNDVKNSSKKLFFQVVFEGDFIKDHNLEYLSKLLNSNREKEVIFFISPTYFIKKELEKSKNKLIDFFDQIKSFGLKIGVHISSQKKMIEFIDEPFLKNPTFWGYDLTEENCQTLCGIEVPISAYPNEIQEELIKKSIEIVSENLEMKVEYSYIEGNIVNKGILDILSNQKIMVHFLDNYDEFLEVEYRHYPNIGKFMGNQNEGSEYCLGKKGFLLDDPLCPENIYPKSAHDFRKIYQSKAFLSLDGFK